MFQTKGTDCSSAIKEYNKMLILYGQQWFGFLKSEIDLDQTIVRDHSDEEAERAKQYAISMVNKCLAEDFRNYSQKVDFFTEGMRSNEIISELPCKLIRKRAMPEKYLHLGVSYYEITLISCPVSLKALANADYDGNHIFGGLPFYAPSTVFELKSKVTPWN